MRPRKTPAPPAGTNILRDNISTQWSWTDSTTTRKWLLRRRNLPNHVIKGQITSLKNTIEMLNSAYRGFDPHLVDNDDEVDTYEPFGDNSGDGSGEVEAIETEPRSRDPDLTCPTCGGSTPSFNVIALSSALLVALRLVVQ
ncbi:uncharacterized protein LOC143458725 [Clavelina lepadiformis]|uniref:uncharacterized protein LOC143458725 n=1 Tax=Clavelina lepadiformis TaxID=159417 RepID=UPI004042E152